MPISKQKSAEYFEVTLQKSLTSKDRERTQLNQISIINSPMYRACGGLQHILKRVTRALLLPCVSGTIFLNHGSRTRYLVYATICSVLAFLVPDFVPHTQSISISGNHGGLGLGSLVSKNLSLVGKYGTIFWNPTPLASAD